MIHSLLFFIIGIGCLGSTDYSSLNDNYPKCNISQMLSIEYNLKLSKKGHEVEEVRSIVTYLKNDLKWTQKKIAEKFKVSESSMTNFFRYNKNPLCLIDAVRYFYKNNPDISLVSPPVVIEKHWYDVFFSKPDSESSLSSKGNDGSTGYLKKDLDISEETELLVEKDKKEKKRD